MNDKVVATSAVAQDKQRLPYTSPKLKVFGQLRDLTDGGSGAILEGTMMTALNRRA